MKFAPIAPPHLLAAVAASGASYHMALGQALVGATAYRQFYSQRLSRGDFIMVDNGAAEPAEERVPFDKVVRAALTLGADEIVLPDVVRDADATLTALRAWSDVIATIPVRKRVVIPQGRHPDECIACFHAIEDMLEFATVGIPKHLEVWPRGRLIVLEAIPERYHVHFFGIYGNPEQEILQLLPFRGRVRGIDSGAPIAYAQRGATVDGGVRYSLDWQLEARQDLILANIRMIRRWCEAV